MAFKIQGPREEISSKTVEGVFDQLKISGYTDSQILALATGLMDLATRAEPVKHACQAFCQNNPYKTLSQTNPMVSSGLDILEDLCKAGLPHKN